jgi:hypothetical protein
MSEITVLAVSNRGVKGSSQGSVEFSGGKGVVVQFSASYDQYGQSKITLERFCEQWDIFHSPSQDGIGELSIMSRR